MKAARTFRSGAFLALALAACTAVLLVGVGCPMEEVATGPATSSAEEILVAGSSVQLDARPGIGKTTWSTSNATVASVSVDGLVTAIGPGVATITATTWAGPATCRVAVGSLYITGSVGTPGDGPHPAYWKNGSLVVLDATPDGYFGWMIGVSHATVCVAGVRCSDNAPVCWVNGTLIPMDGLPPNGGWNFTGVAISGGDISITANAYVGSGGQTPWCWHNGTWYSLPGVTTGQVCGAVAAAGHVYMAGNDLSTGKPVCWVDGLLQVLPGGGWISSAFPAIVASGSDIYIAGTTSSGTGPTPIVWKNGKIHFRGRGGLSSVISIAVHGSDVYLAGIVDSSTVANSTNPCRPVYWKNGVEHALAFGGPQATAWFVAGGAHVYAAGKPIHMASTGDPCTPLFWKDGALVPLPVPAGDSNALISCMAGAGDEAFLFGTTGPGPAPTDLNHPVYWQNGVLHQLPTGTWAGGTTTPCFCIGAP